MMATSRNRLSTWLAAVALAAVVTPSLASAQSRLSLAERVGRLETQAQQAQGGVGVVNQVQLLQTQIQALQGQVEQLQHELQQLKQSNKDQYVDLDSRLARLEGGAPAALSGPAATGASGPDQLPDVQLGGPPVVAAPGDTPAVPTDTGVAAGTTPASPADAQADYDRAFDELRSGDFPAASRLFAAFIQRYPQSDLAPNAYYWLGESYYATQNYPIALDTFQNLLQRFPTSSKAAGALLKVGYSHYEMQQWDAAGDALNQVIQQYPGSTEARMAEGRLRALRVHANR